MYLQNFTLKPLQINGNIIGVTGIYQISTDHITKFEYDGTVYTLVQKEGKWCVYDIDTFKVCTLKAEKLRGIENIHIIDEGFTQPLFLDAGENPVEKKLGRTWYYPGEFTIDTVVYEKIGIAYRKRTEAEVKMILLEKENACLKEKIEEMDKDYKKLYSAAAKIQSELITTSANYYELCRPKGNKYLNYAIMKYLYDRY